MGLDPRDHASSIDAPKGQGRFCLTEVSLATLIGGAACGSALFWLLIYAVL